MRLVFICPCEKRPVGGVKVIYKYAEILARGGTKAFVYHPQKNRYKGALPKIAKRLGINLNVLHAATNTEQPSWFAHSAQLRPSQPFDPNSDFLIIPETLVWPFGNIALERGFRYAILVQNGYLIDSGRETASEKLLSNIYKNALFILSISENTTKILKLCYPEVPFDRIRRVLPHVEPVFAPALKENVITYMPRKLGSHAAKLVYMLRDRIGKKWRFCAIDNVDESCVASALSRSKIFLSFSHLEGFALPPLEAALSGNVVIGYTGEGAKEYFKGPIFREIAPGDFLGFAWNVLEISRKIETSSQISRELKKAVQELRTCYSESQETKFLREAFKEFL